MVKIWCGDEVGSARSGGCRGGSFTLSLAGGGGISLRGALLGSPKVPQFQNGLCIRFSRPRCARWWSRLIPISQNIRILAVSNDSFPM